MDEALHHPENEIRRWRLRAHCSCGWNGRWRLWPRAILVLWDYQDHHFDWPTHALREHFAEEYPEFVVCRHQTWDGDVLHVCELRVGHAIDTLHREGRASWDDSGRLVTDWAGDRLD